MAGSYEVDTDQNATGGTTSVTAASVSVATVNNSLSQQSSGNASFTTTWKWAPDFQGEDPQPGHVVCDFDCYTGALDDSRDEQYPDASAEAWAQAGGKVGSQDVGTLGEMAYNNSHIAAQHAQLHYDDVMPGGADTVIISTTSRASNFASATSPRSQGSSSAGASTSNQIGIHIVVDPAIVPAQ